MSTPESGVSMSQIGYQQIANLGKRAMAIVQQAREVAVSPERAKQLRTVYSMVESAKLVDRDRSTLLRYVKQGLIPAAKEHVFEQADDVDEDGNVVKRPPIKKLGYTFHEIHEMRKILDTFPYRDENEEAQVIGVQNFKGGSSKTSMGVGLAHYLTLRGYRTLLIDMDPQGSSTSTHDLMPEADVKAEETLSDILAGTKGPEFIEDLIRPTYWPQLDIIPANMALFDGEMLMYHSVLTAGDSDASKLVFRRFHNAIAHIKSRYDVVVLDTQPGLGGLGINAFCAADSVLVPCPPKMYDFGSTASFLMLWASYLKQVWPEKRYSFVKIVATQVQTSDTQTEIMELMRAAFGTSMLSKQMLFKKDIQRAASLLRSPYEDHQMSAAVIAMLDSLFKSVELDIWRFWPSKRKQRELALERMAEVA